MVEGSLEAYKKWKKSKFSIFGGCGAELPQNLNVGVLGPNPAKTHFGSISTKNNGMVVVDGLLEVHYWVEYNEI